MGHVVTVSPVLAHHSVDAVVHPVNVARRFCLPAKVPYTYTQLLVHPTSAAGVARSSSVIVKIQWANLVLTALAVVA